MTEFGTLIFAWLATAWLHGLFLFAAAWTAERFGLLRSGGLRQAAWRGVLLVPLATAALQLGALGGSPTYRQDLAPAPATAAPTAMAAPASTPLAILPTQPPVTVRAQPLDTGRIIAATPAVLGWAWLAWAALAALGVGVQRLQLMAYRRRLAPLADPVARDLADHLRRRAGLKRLGLYEDPALSGPMALAGDAIVVPSWARAALSEPQRAALLAHEVRHLVRRDPEWRAGLGLAALAALAPHARLVLSRLDALSEQACDAWSAEATGEGRALAQCLAACLERGLRDPGHAWSSAMARGPVVERVRRLLDGAATFEAARPRHAALLLAGLGVAALALPGFAVGQAVIPPRADPAVQGLPPGVRPIAEPVTPVLAAEATIAMLAAEADAPALPAEDPEEPLDALPALAAIEPVAPVEPIADLPEPADLPDLPDRVRPHLAPVGALPPELGVLTVLDRMQPAPAIPATPAVPAIPPVPAQPRPVVAPTPPVPPNPPRPIQGG